MKTSSWPPETLRLALVRAGAPANSRIADLRHSVALEPLISRGVLGAQLWQLAGKSVLIATGSQFETALALLDLDGVARRIVLLPPDVADSQLPAIIRDAAVEAIIASSTARFSSLRLPVFELNAAAHEAVPHVSSAEPTQWLMLTSGTTGDPKLAIHTLSGLAGAIGAPQHDAERPVWATFYDIRRYGGLQIFLRAMLSGGGLILSQPGEAIADHLHRLAAAGVTHVSGTPTHWRRILMGRIPGQFAPRYIRLSGEIADQAVLDALRLAFPEAAIGHAYASTEAGVGFEVTDGLEGFPASYLDGAKNGVELRIAGGCLQLRSRRRALAYAGRPDLQLADAEGWVDSGDMVELRNGRYRFVGRRNGVINVGGLKVHPEEIEAVINRHVAVRQAKVRARKSPILGSIVVADVLLSFGSEASDALKRDLIEHCARSLPAHKVPALVNFVPAIDMTAGGKLARQNA